MINAGGRELGFPFLFEIEPSLAIGAAGTQFEIPLSCIPKRQGNLAVNVLGIILRLPTAAFTVAASKVVDGVTLAQLISAIEITLGTDSPPAQYNGGHQIVENMDGYRALQMLHYMSGGQPLFLGVGGSGIADFVATGADVTGTGTTITQFKRQKRRGWLQHQGEFGEADAGGAAWSERVYLYLPIGHKAGEKLGDNAIPATWFGGEGGCSGNGGKIKMTLGTTVDNAAVTWTTSDGVRVLAACMLSPLDNAPVPTVPHIKVSEGSSSEYLSNPGVRAYLGFMKALTSAGAMQSHSYTRVQAYVAGQELLYDTVGDSLLMENLLQTFIGEDTFYITPAESSGVFTARAQTRYTGCGIPILSQGIDSLVKSQGSLLESTRLKVITHGETGNPPHKIMDAVWTPVSPELAEAAKKWSLMPGLEAVAQTKNGNAVSPQMAAALPHKLVRVG